MKIGVIAHLKHAIRDPFAGGLEMHTFTLCHWLRRRGHEVTLFAAAGSAKDLGLEAICRETGKAPINAELQFRYEHRSYLSLMEMLRTQPGNPVIYAKIPSSLIQPVFARREVYTAV